MPPALKWLFDTDRVSLHERGYPGLRNKLVRLCGSIPVVAFDLACEQKFQELRAQGIRVGSQDLKIASTALANDLVLVTRNTRDFKKIPRLSVEDWSLD